MRNLFAAIGLLALMACGNGTREAPKGLIEVGGAGFRVLNGACALDASGALSGTCGLLSTADLGGVSASKSFAIRFLLEDGGALTLRAFSQNLQGGVDLRFFRLGSTLRFVGTIGGNSVDHSRRFTQFNASDEIAMQIDVHNNEAPSHVIVWAASAGPAFNLSDKLVNSAFCGIGNNPNYDCSTNWGSASGTGSTLGVTLDKATLIQLNVSAPKYEE